MHEELLDFDSRSVHHVLCRGLREQGIAAACRPCRHLASIVTENLPRSIDRRFKRSDKCNLRQVSGSKRPAVCRCDWPHMRLQLSSIASTSEDTVLRI